MVAIERNDLIGNALKRTGEAVEVTGSVLSPIVERVGKTGVIFLSYKFHRVRRSHS